jgi:hypothetical protein
MTTLKTFRIDTITEFGLGCFEKKGKSINDCFNKLSTKQKSRSTQITDIETDEFRFIENSMLLEDGITLLEN